MDLKLVRLGWTRND